MNILGIVISAIILSYITIAHFIIAYNNPNLNGLHVFIRVVTFNF